MRVAIIGAGKMGRWFTRFFHREGDSVVVSSRSKEKLLKIRDELGVEIVDSNVEAIEEADRVLLCVPLESLEIVLKEIGSHIHQDQVVIDICSIKEASVNLLHKYIKKGITLGTHPVFGPGAKSMEAQNFILTPINDKERRFAEEFKGWLEEKGAKVVIMAPRKHDELMSLVLGFPHFIGLVVGDTLLNDARAFRGAKDVAGASYRLLLTLAEAVASEETGFYASLQMSLPEVEKIEGLFLDKVKAWLNMVRRKDHSAFTRQMKSVKKRLKELDADYERYYQVMYQLFDNAKS